MARVRSNQRQRLTIERFERREVLSSVGITNGLLTVIGNSTSDTIYVRTFDGVTATASVEDSTSGVIKSIGIFNLASFSAVNVQGLGGDDYIQLSVEQPGMLDGGAGNDTLYGGWGSDSLMGGDGDDRLWAEGGHDTLSGGNGHDLLRGGVGTDSLEGGAGRDTLYGGTGSDTLTGGNDNDALYGEGDNDLINGDAGNDSLWGDVGTDTLIGGTGYDTTHGGAGNDRIYTDALDQVYGEAGNDQFDGLKSELTMRNPNGTVYRDWGVI